LYFWNLLGAETRGMGRAKERGAAAERTASKRKPGPAMTAEPATQNQEEIER
jgi:hypothetical protein